MYVRGIWLKIQSVPYVFYAPIRNIHDEFKVNVTLQDNTTHDICFFVAFIAFKGIIVSILCQNIIKLKNEAITASTLYMFKNRDQFHPTRSSQGCIYSLPFTFDLNTTRVYYSLHESLWWNASIVRTFPQKRVRKSFFRFFFQPIHLDEPRRKFRA